MRVCTCGAASRPTHTFAAHRDAFRVLYSMAALDPDAVGGVIQRAEERRWGGMA